MRSRRGSLAGVVAAAIVGSLLIAGQASANTVTIGSVLPSGPTSVPVEEVQTFLNTALPEKGANLSSPATGTVVRWRLQGAKGGPFYLRVLRPNGLGAYTAVGTSDPVIVSSTAVQTFNTNLPIKTGDLIGVDPTNTTDELGFATAAGSAFTTIFPTPFEGATAPGREPKSGKELELSAEVQPAPAITEIAPSSGSVAGGTVVKITGTNLTGASAVKFGTLTAATFKVESDDEIVATAPKSPSVGGVDITVTTLAGTSATSSSDRFSYIGCVVPKVVGKKLGLAKQLITRSGCKVGKVTLKKGVDPKKAKVKSQSPKAGKVVVKGKKVNLTAR